MFFMSNVDCERGRRILPRKPITVRRWIDAGKIKPTFTPLDSVRMDVGTDRSISRTSVRRRVNPGKIKLTFTLPYSVRIDADSDGSISRTSATDDDSGLVYAHVSSPERRDVVQ